MNRRKPTESPYSFHLLSSEQIRWINTVKRVAEQQQNTTRMRQKLDEITKRCTSLNELSLEDLDIKLHEAITTQTKQDDANKQLAQEVQTVKRELTQKINQKVALEEKEASEAFEVERRQSKIALDDTKKQLADALRLSKQLDMEELTLQKDLSATLAAESEIALLLNSSETTLNETHRLLDQKLFLKLQTGELLVALTFTSNLSFRYAIHWRLGFISLENKNLCKAINHFNAAIKGNPALYKNNNSTSILQNLKKSFLPSVVGGSQKQLFEKAKKAYQENNFDEAIMYAELAIDLGKQTKLFDEYNLLMDVYLYLKDWINVGLIYQQLGNNQRVNKSTRALIDEKIKYALRLFFDSGDPYSIIQLLKVSSINTLSEHYSHFKENAILQVNTDHEYHYRAIQLHMNRTSTTLAGICTLELISLFARQNRLQNMYEQLTWIDRQTEIPLFLNAWAHFMVAEFLHKQGEMKPAEQEYKLALASMPSLTEAREALDVLSRDKINRERFFQPTNAGGIPPSCPTSTTPNNIPSGGI